MESGSRESQHKKENEHKRCPEHSEFLWCSANLGVPRNLAGMKTDASKEKRPQIIADIDLVASRQAAHHTPNSHTQEQRALALPLLHGEKSPADPLICFQGLFLSSCSLPAFTQLQTSRLSFLSPAASPTPALWTDLDT